MREVHHVESLVAGPIILPDLVILSFFTVIYVVSFFSDLFQALHVFG